MDNYEERYRAALSRARELSKTVTGANYEYIFPELKKPEDEEIRRALIENFIFFGGDHLETSKWGKDDDLLVTDILAWLEKQGGQPTDKIEPKFKVGDWVVEPRDGEPNGLWHIERIEDNHYRDGRCGVRIEHADKYYHLWTIQDAKDGDVLVSDDVMFIFNYIHGVWVKCHCSLRKDGSFKGRNYDLMYAKDSKEVYPATKEQRDLLFAKMKEAGYKWDTKKKELKKIESKKLNADEVIEWLNHRELRYDDVVTTVIPDDSPTSVCHKVKWLSDEFIERFKKDFEL